MSDDTEHDPQAVHGPEDCVPAASDLAVDVDDAEDGIEECAWNPIEEHHDTFTGIVDPVPMGPDGLPDHSAKSDFSDAEASAFTYHNVCCIADEREFVELFTNELRDRDRVVPQMAMVHGACDAARFQYNEDGTARERERFEPSEIVERWGELFALRGARLVPVRARREVCVHYKRQHLPTTYEMDPRKPGHNEVRRMCTHPGRRSVAGAAMSLSNQSVYGCDFRDPPDPKSSAWMNKFDNDKLVNKPHLVRLPLFGMQGDIVHVPDEEPS